jgi:hypothetical protein
MPRIEIESDRVERAEDLADRSSEAFDRIELTSRAIALIGPRFTRIAICEGHAGVQVSIGRQWGAPRGARWAIVSVAPDASRRAIASAVLSLYDGHGEGAGSVAPYRSARAWALDVLMTELSRGGAPPTAKRWGHAP